jgi:hypothetical protein
MDTALRPIAAELAELGDGDLHSLQAAADNGPQFAPDLLALIAHACDWETARRHGRAFMLSGPHAAIAPEELGESFAAFAERPHVAALFEAIGDTLTGTASRH